MAEGHNSTRMIEIFPNITTSEVPTISSGMSVTRALSYTVGCLGLIGNLLVVVVMTCVSNKGQKISLYFVINLAVSDFLAALFMILTTALPPGGLEYEASIADKLYCGLWASSAPFWICLSCSTWCLVAVTLERYLAVLHPITYKQSFTRPWVVVIMVAVWIFAIVRNMAVLVPTSHILNGKCVIFYIPNVLLMRGVGASFFFVDYLIPLIILAYSYTRMALVFNTRVGAVITVTSGQQLPQKNLAVKRNIIKTMILVSVALVIALSANQWFFFLVNIGALDLDPKTATFRQVAALMIVSNCCVNPFIYAARYTLFQRGLKKLFCIWRKDDNGVSTVSESVTE